MVDLTVVQEFPTPKLTLIGFSDKGASIVIGSIPLVDPTQREEITSKTFLYIEECVQKETMCTIGNFLFFPSSFDFFTVQ